uniref:Alkyl transferase n=2 Tax=Elaeis guineensis var. tenera TaxID=51953 RepID=A0A6I9QIZ0_ELAGV|nr:dehydrodolichyl diphosphate synthase 2 isoform X1 [Elaeis guineensis]
MSYTMLSSSPFHFRFPFPYPSPPSPVISNTSSPPGVPPNGGGGGCRPPPPPLVSYIPSLGMLVPFPKKKPCCVLPADAAAPIESKWGAWRGEHEEDEEDALPSGLRREWLPRHVAVIMDGNSRWAKARNLPTSAGHEAGYRTLREMLRLSCVWGIRVLTVFAFSYENWLRPKVEVDFLMMLFERVLRENIRDFLRECIWVRVIGDSSKLPISLQKLAKEVEEMTRNNSRLELVVAVSYSGRRDIAQACQKISQKVKHGLLEPEQITESLIAQELETNGVEFPYPDLLIRTSGEERLSNFLLWQSAYSELFFTETYWPDFGEADYVEALSSFQKRQRRFGQRIT